MIYRLGNGAVGLVLWLLPPEDLKAARLAARAFDAASRAQLEAARTLTLAPQNAGGGKGARIWSRFPRLRRLVLRSWGKGQGDDEALRGLFPEGAAGALDGLREVDAGIRDTKLGSNTLAAILRHAPGVTRLIVSDHGLDDAGELAVLATIGAMAPRLAYLRAYNYGIDTRGAELINRLLPELRSLSVGCTSTGASDRAEGEARVWDALPCSRLTALEFTVDMEGIPEHMLQNLSWHAMRRLVGIHLWAEEAELVARGMPNLEKLSAFPTGDWSQGSGTVFPCVTHARLRECGSSFLEHLQVSRLLPSIESLHVMPDISDCSLDLCGATNLARLVFTGAHSSGVFGMFLKLSSSVWRALQALPRLQQLAIDMTVQEVEELGKLTSLEVLSAAVAYDFDEAEGEPVWAPGQADYDICHLLEATVRMPRLRALRLSPYHGGCLRHGPLAQVVASPHGRLEELEVWGKEALRLQDVSLLAALRGLSRLSVRLAPSSSDPAHGRLLTSLWRSTLAGA